MLANLGNTAVGSPFPQRWKRTVCIPIPKKGNAKECSNYHTIREGNGNSLQYRCLENPMDRGAWWARVHGVAKHWTQVNDFTFFFFFFHSFLPFLSFPLSFFLASMWDECSYAVVWTFFGISFLWDWNENWNFLVLWPLLSFPNLLTYWVQHFHSIIF